MKRNKKPLLIGALAVLLVALVVGGTIAWLTAEDDLVNSFTVGTFNKPTEDPKPDGGGDEDEDESGNPTDPDTDGFLFETEWKDGQTFIPGDPVAKNPNVGVGKDSQDPYVFIYVKNNAVDSADNIQGYGPYFTIQKQWAPVTDGNGNAPDVSARESTSTDGAADGAYVDGLFMYVKNYTGSENKPVVFDVAAAIQNQVTAGNADAANAYTGELFQDITIPDGNGEHIVAKDANVTVYAYLYGSDAEATEGEEGSASAALNSAVLWAEGLAQGN